MSEERDREEPQKLTLIVDDAGSGDLLFGVVVGAYHQETGDFKYDLIDVSFYQDIFREKEYLQESSRVVSKLVSRFNLKSTSAKAASLMLQPRSYRKFTAKTALNVYTLMAKRKG